MAIESGPVTTRSADELTGRLRIEGVHCVLKLNNSSRRLLLAHRIPVDDFFSVHCCTSYYMLSQHGNVAAGPMCSILEALADTGDGGQCIIGQECMRLLSKSNEKYSPAPFLSRHLARYKV